MLEAARLASCAVNATFLKAIVVIRDDIPREILDAIKTPVSGLNIELAPVHIYTFADMGATRARRRGSRSWSMSARSTPRMDGVINSLMNSYGRMC